MRALFLITAAAAVAAPALADTKAGVDAWGRGDYRIAVDQWRAAAARGDPDALFNLGQAYKLGRGVPVDTWKAQDYYRQAADKSHAEAADYYGLALFQNGRPREAIPYLEKAAERGEPRAQYLYGTMLFNGIDIKKDWVRAYALLTQAQRAGLPQADAALVQMNAFIPAEQRRQGQALAAAMAPPPVPAPAVAASAVANLQAPPPPPAAKKAPARAVAVANPVIGGSWRLQLGAFGDSGNARRLGRQLAGRFPGRRIDYVPAGALTRVLAGPYASRATAQAACGTIRPCVPVGP